MCLCATHDAVIDPPHATRVRVTTAFSEYGEVVSISLRKKGGEFDSKNWALVTFAEPEAAGRALFSEVSARMHDVDSFAKMTSPSQPQVAVHCNRRWLSTRRLTRSS